MLGRRCNGASSRNFLAVIRRSDCRAHRGQETTRNAEGYRVRYWYAAALCRRGNSDGSVSVVSRRVACSGRLEEGYVVGVASHDPTPGCCPGGAFRSGRETRAVIASDEIFHRPVTFPSPAWRQHRCVLGLRMCVQTPHYLSRASHRRRAALRFPSGFPASARR